MSPGAAGTAGSEGSVQGVTATSSSVVGVERQDQGRVEPLQTIDHQTAAPVV